jgi:hypothetical protein
MSCRAGIVLLALALCVGCASRWDSKSQSHATVYTTTSEIPLLVGGSTFISAVDGVATDRGKGYVLVGPGPHQLTITRISCTLPVLVVTCLKSARQERVEADLRPGFAYRVDDVTRAPFPIGVDGLPVDVPYNPSLERP